MSAKQFEHFLNLQQRMAGLHRPARRASRVETKNSRETGQAVTAAKAWLAKAAGIR